MTGPRALTLFSIPKPFEGEIGDLQRVALKSWVALPGVRVIVFGDEPGAAEAAREAGAEHVPGLAREEGTPRLDYAFAQAESLDETGVLCFTNADILFGPDLLAAVRAVQFSPFLVVGETLDVDPALVRGVSQEEIRRVALDGVRRGPTAIDYFVFTRGLFDPLPAFVVGRAGFDNWLIWRARQEAAVIDATRAVVAVHQRHDYLHVAGGKDAAYYGPEAARNIALGGGRSRVYTLHDASHRMDADLSVHRNLGSILRAGETVRKVRWKLGVR